MSREKGRLEAAIAYFTKAIELDPRLAIAYASRGLVRLRQGNTEEGEKDFASSLRLDPGLSTFIEGEKRRMKPRLQ